MFPDPMTFGTVGQLTLYLFPGSLHGMNYNSEHKKICQTPKTVLGAHYLASLDMGELSERYKHSRRVLPIHYLVDICGGKDEDKKKTD